MARRPKTRMESFPLKRASSKTEALTGVGQRAADEAARHVNGCVGISQSAGSRSRAGVREKTSFLPAVLLVLGATFSPATQGQSLIQDEQGWVYVDKKGEAILRPFIYDNGPDYLEEGLARFVANGKMGFHDQALKIWIPAQYDFAFPFQDGQAKVGMNCKFIPQGEHRSVHCQHWQSISNPLTGSKDQPEN